MSVRALLDGLDAIAQAIDRGAWSEAAQALAQHDARVREAVASGALVAAQDWRDLMQRHAELTLKLASLRADTAARIEALQRDRGAARRCITAYGT